MSPDNRLVLIALWVLGATALAVTLPILWWSGKDFYRDRTAEGLVYLALCTGIATVFILFNLYLWSGGGPR